MAAAGGSSFTPAGFVHHYPGGTDLTARRAAAVVDAESAGSADGEEPRAKRVRRAAMGAKEWDYRGAVRAPIPPDLTLCSTVEGPMVPGGGVLNVLTGRGGRWCWPRWFGSEPCRCAGWRSSMARTWSTPVHALGCPQHRPFYSSPHSTHTLALCLSRACFRRAAAVCLLHLMPSTAGLAHCPCVACTEELIDFKLQKCRSVPASNALTSQIIEQHFRCLAAWLLGPQCA